MFKVTVSLKYPLRYCFLVSSCAMVDKLESLHFSCSTAIDISKSRFAKGAVGTAAVYNGLNGKICSCSVSSCKIQIHHWHIYMTDMLCSLYNSIIMLKYLKIQSVQQNMVQKYGEPCSNLDTLVWGTQNCLEMK